MQTIRQLPSSWTSGVLTIGHFDGVHLGHHAVLAGLFAAARQMHLPSVLMTFEPYATEYFNKQSAPARITVLRDKVLALATSGLDYLYVKRFDQHFSAMTARQFVLEELVRKLKVRKIIIGEDFRFGAGRTGDVQFLRLCGEEFGFEVESIASYAQDGERVSSTAIRAALHKGDFYQANRMLGRAFTISGRVRHGDERGRKLGFPTLNLAIKHRVTPIQGVFAVRVHGVAPKAWPGVANLGCRPTVDGKHINLETYLFDFDKQIYRQHVEVEFVRKLREEEKFPTLDAMVEQIREDARMAREVLCGHG